MPPTIPPLQSPLYDPKVPDMVWGDALPGHHTAGIVCADVALRRPLLVTGSLDQTLRVWHYIDARCEVQLDLR